jgi:hypothetical protein
VLSGSVLADFTFNVTAVSKGNKIDWKAAGLEILTIPQQSRFHRHGDNSTAGTQHPHGKRAGVSGNWCGISQKVQSNRDTLSSVYGHFQVPNLSFRPGFPYPQWASAWIGMDGGTCSSALLQSGVTVVVRSPNIMGDERRDNHGLMRSCLAQLEWRAERLGLVRMGPPGIIQNIRLPWSVLSTLASDSDH